MPNPDLGHSETSRRWTLAINEQGSMIGQWAPGCEIVEVMPVAEHEALRAAAEGVFDASGGDALADALQRLGLVLSGEADDA